MLIKENTLQHWIDHYYGYGSWNAKLWFVAYEDGGGDLPEEVAERFNYFYDKHAANTPSLCDIRELYKQVSVGPDKSKEGLLKTLHDHRFGKHAVLHGIWKNLIGFVHGYENKKLPDLLSYQLTSFASPSAQREALIPLYPLPSPHNHAWYYTWLDMPQFPFLKSRKGYEDHVYTQRMHTLLGKINEHKPAVVLMYDMSNINDLKKSVQEFFPSVKFKMTAGVKLKTPQHHRADLPHTTLLITTQTPALKHNRIETGFDWYELGKMIRQ